MTELRALAANEPVMIAWEAYKASPDYENTKRWAREPEHVDGSLWAAFSAGFAAMQPTPHVGDADVRELALASELRAVRRALEHLPEFHVREPDLDMDIYLARRILREASTLIESLLTERERMREAVETAIRRTLGCATHLDAGLIEDTVQAVFTSLNDFA